MTKKTNTISEEPLSLVILEDNLGDFVLLEDYLIEMYRSATILHYSTLQDFIDAKVHEQDHFSCDLVLLDLHLPDASGMQLVERIVEICPDIPVVILTGYVDLPLAKKSLELGIDDFLIKDEINVSLLHKCIEFTRSRYNYVHQIELQNAKLRNIAWTQSHVVRAPLARLLGLVELLQTVETAPDELPFFVEQIRVAAEEMDTVVREIVNEAQSIGLLNEKKS